MADLVGDGSQLLSRLAAGGVDLLAFKATPLTPRGAQFTLCPIDGTTMTKAAKRAGLNLTGPHAALWIKGGEEPGALAGIYERLARAGVSVRESSGIAHIDRGFGVVLYLEPGDCARAAAALRE